MNLSTIKPFLIQSEAVPGNGEDSGFVRCFENGLVVSGVFDGCGGIGGRRYPGANGRTGAFIGSRLAAFAAESFFKRSFRSQNEKFIIEHFKDPGKYTDMLRDYIFRKMAGVKQKLAQGDGIQIGGSLSRSLPTTISIITSISAGQFTLNNFIWAGDSRGYMLDKRGLCQLTTDDIDMNADDAFRNLREDGILTNVASGDRNFILHSGVCALSRPAMLINATDGCFAYFLTPMDFENVILTSLEDAANPAQWMKLLGDRIKAVAGDDCTLAISCFGFEDFEDMKEYYSERQRLVAGEYISRQEGADETALMQLWERYKPGYYGNTLRISG